MHSILIAYLLPIIVLSLIFKIAFFLFPISKDNEEIDMNNFFEIKRETQIKDIFEISIIFLIITIPIVGFSMLNEYKYQNAPLRVVNAADTIAHDISSLNMFLKTNNQLSNFNKEKIYKESLAKSISKREAGYNLIAGYNFKDDKGKFIKYKPKWYYKKSLNSDLEKLPILFNAYGSMFFVIKADGYCGINPPLDHKRANCVLLADINGLRPPNKMIKPENVPVTSYKKDDIGDRYYIILGNKKAYLEKSFKDKLYYNYKIMYPNQEVRYKFE